MTETHEVYAAYRSPLIKMSSYIAALAISIPITQALQIGPFQIQLSEILLLLGVLFATIQLNTVRIPAEAASVIGLYLIFLVTISLSIPGAIDQFIAFKGLVKWFFGFVGFCLVLIFIKDAQSWFRVYNAFRNGLAALMILVTAVASAFPGSIGGSGFEVPFLISENRLGQFACISVILSFISIFRGFTFLKVFVGLVSIFVLVISFNKTAYIVCAFVLGAILVILLFTRRALASKVKWLIKLSVLVPPLVVFSVAVFQEVLIHRLPSMLAALNDPLQYSTMLHRYDSWAAMVEAANNNLFGIGLYNTSEITSASHAHSVIFELIGTAGYPGVIAFLLLIFALFLHGVTIIFVRGLPIEVLGVTLSAFAYFIMNLMSDSFGPSTHLLFWIPAALFVIAPSSRRHAQVNPLKKDF